MKNRTVKSSTGSTQNSVLAAPPQAYSPALQGILRAAGSMTTENPSPKPTPGSDPVPTGFEKRAMSRATRQVVASHIRHGPRTQDPHAIELAAM